MLTEPRRSPTYPDLANEVAVVTGGSRGIGAATARALAANGVRVAVNGRDRTAIDRTVAEIRAGGGRAAGVAADCTSFADVDVSWARPRTSRWPRCSWPRTARRGSPA
jgi:3-oxoacyl-[acyl-carrier protein] reductase